MEVFKYNWTCPAWVLRAMKAQPALRLTLSQQVSLLKPSKPVRSPEATR